MSAAPQPTPDSRVAKVVAEIDCTPGFAKDMLADIEAAGLLVLDPFAQQYDPLTHEYPPTLDIAVDVIRALSARNQALTSELAALRGSR